jgi:DAACS family dicarboxylate/amino acid:cation (Na+ or H+) symporter
MSSDRPRRFSLHTLILLGLVLGAALGSLANAVGPALEAWWSANFYPAQIVEPLVANVMQPIGQVFLRLLIMTVVPLVFCSLAVGVARLGDLRQLGRIGAKTFAVFFGTMALAVIIGLVLVNTVRPGDGLSEEAAAALRQQYGGGKTTDAAHFGIDTFVNMIPANPIAAATDIRQMFGVIVFALLVGVGLTVINPERARLIVSFLEGFADLMVVIINIAMRVAPVGVFALIFSATARFGFGLLRPLGLYVAVVLIGLAIQMFGTLSLLVWSLGRMSPWTFFRKVRDVMITAFSTSSSSATLPTSLQCAEKELGVPKPLASFVLPLGATMNMNGTALFEGVTVVFLAQVFHVPLDLGMQAIVVILAVLTAIGAAGVPGGSIPLLVMVLATARVPEGGIAIILGVDRLLDMCRTTLNVIGDLAAAVVVARSEGHPLNGQAAAAGPNPPPVASPTGG